MRRTGKWLLAAVLLISLCLGGCSTVDEKQPKQEAQKDTITIGMSFDSFVIERWQRDRDVFVSIAKQLGAQVNVQNAGGDVQEQINQIDYFIKKGVDAIVIISIDSSKLKDSVQRAKDAGIKIIAYDRLIENADVDLYISFDNAKVGSLMGEALVEAGIAGKNVLMLGGSTADLNVTAVEDAFKSEMEKNHVTVVDSFHAEGWRAEAAAEYVYAHPDTVAGVSAIMCGNDDLASRVVPALAESRLLGEMLVVGQDADLEACQRIVEGTQLMTVYKPVEKLAKRAAECTMALIKGEELTGDDLTTIDDGEYEVPYVALMPIAVDATNLDDVIIGSGFHLKEDVYLNMQENMP